MMVRPPDVDDEVRAALELVQMIGNVGRKIGVLAILASYHAILLVAESRGTEPCRPVLFVKMAVLVEALQRALDQPRIVERALREPVIESNAEFGEIAATVFELLVQGEIVKVRVVTP